MIELGISGGPVERRQQADGLDLIAGLLSGSGVGTVRDAALGGLQIAAGRVARALSVATVEGDGGLLTPDILAGIGYDLTRQGEALHLFSVDPLTGSPSLLRASTTVPVIAGSADPRTWRYSLSVPGPSVDRRVDAVAAEVCHVRINSSPWSPWRGRSPLRVAESTGRLSGGVASALYWESQIPAKAIFPMPQGVSEPTQQTIRQFLTDQEKPVVAPATTAGGFGAGRTSAPLSDWKASRISPDWPAAGVDLHALVLGEVLAVCGVPASLAPGSAAAGPTLREAQREFLLNTVQPYGALVAAEASRVLERPVTLTFDALAAADSAGRARAFGILAKNNIEKERALRMVGWGGPSA